MHQVTIDANCHLMHYLFQDGASPSLEAVVRDFTARDEATAFGLGCSICDYGTETLEQPGLVAFYVEQAKA